VLEPSFAEVLSSYERSLARAAALLLPLVSCAVLANFRDTVTSATAALILVVWVVATAAVGDRVAGLLAALSGGLWFDFFLTQPYHRLAISDSDDVEVTVLLVLIGVVVTEIALWGRRQQERAARRTGYLDGVLSTAKAVSEGDAPTPTLIDVVAHQIVEVLASRTAVSCPGPSTTGDSPSSIRTAPWCGTAMSWTSCEAAFRSTKRSPSSFGGDRTCSVTSL
jgi:K+-sensing histidine kinase KdpD